MTGAEARIPRAFAGAEIGDYAEWVFRGPIGGPVSNPEFPISGICPMGLAETGQQLPLRTPSRLEVLCARAQAQFFGSGEPELLFLFGPDYRQIADEPGDGQIGRRPALGDRFDDARGEISDRR
jgi:hypothetical protein